MNIYDAIDAASSASGVTLIKISRAIGRSKQFMHTIRLQRNIPSIDLVGMIFHACGYKLCAVKGRVPKNAIVIDAFLDGETYAEHMDGIESE